MLEASMAEVVVRREAMRLAGWPGRHVNRHELSNSVRQFIYEKYMCRGSGTAPARGASKVAVRREAVRLAGRPERAGGRRETGIHLHSDSGKAGVGAVGTVRRLLVAVKPALLALTAVLFTALAFAGVARADSVVLAQSGLVIGAQTDNFVFTAPSAGTLDVQLTDFVWPTALQNLTLSITSATDTLGTLLGPGDASLTLDAGGTYYAHLMGQAAGQWDMGAFGLLGTFSQPVAPVPLPPAVTLLLGGVLAMLWSIRRRAGRLHWGRLHWGATDPR